MSDLLPPVVATLIADIKQFSADMDKAQVKMAETSAKADEMGKGSMLGGLTAGVVGATVLATGAVAGLGAIAIKTGMDFQSAMTQVQNSAGLTQKQTDALGNAFLGTAFKTEFSSTEMANAYAGVAGQLETLNGSALTSSQAMGFINPVMDLATAKSLDLGSAMGSVVTAMKAFQVPVRDAGSAINDIYVTSQITGASVDSLGGQFTRLHSKLGIAMPSLQDMSTLMVDMSMHGVGQGRAITLVAGAMDKLLSPSTKNIQLLQQMGIAAYGLDGKFVGMQSVLGQLAPAFANMSQQQQLATATTLFGAGAAQSMLTLINAGPSAYAKAAAAIQNHATVTQGAANAAGNLKNELKTIQAGGTDLLIKVGTAISGPVSGFIAGVLGGAKPPAHGGAWTIGVDVKEIASAATSHKPPPATAQGFWGEIIKAGGQMFKDIGGLGASVASQAVHESGAGFDLLTGNTKAAANQWGQSRSGFGAGMRSWNDIVDFETHSPGSTGGNISRDLQSIKNYDPKKDTANANILPKDWNITSIKNPITGKVGITGLIKGDMGITGQAANGISTTSSNSQHLQGIPGIRNTSSLSADRLSTANSHLSAIKGALDKKTKITVKATFS